MLANEAQWVSRVLTSLPDEAFPLLNVGSQTSRFREVDQPCIDRDVFAPLRRADRRVVHTDLRDGEGIDVSGDLMDAAFRDHLVNDYGIQSVVCCNVLEHVPDPLLIGSTLAQFVAQRGGHLVVTVPRSFPYHPDPIDTMFRPSPAELAEMLQPLQQISGVEVRSGSLVGYSVRRLLHNRGSAVSNFRDAVEPHASERPPRAVTDLLPWLVRPFVVTCGWYRAPIRHTELP
jgi:hypothetical protein